MPLTIAGLTTEINADSKGLGYATLRTQANAPELLANKLNEAGASAEVLFKAYTPIEDILAAIVLSEFNALTAAQKTACDLFLRGDRVKSGDPNVRTTFLALFGAGTVTRTNLTNLVSRPASRAEALWGEGTMVTDAQASEAISG